MDLFIDSEDGHRLFARKEGHGSTNILFVHGFPFNHTQWLPQLEELGEIATMIAPDLRGLGASGGPQEPSAYSMAAYSGDLNRWLDEAGWERAVLAGLSMGGYILFDFLRRNPGRLLGLILMDTHPFADSPETVEGRRRSREQVESGGTAAIVDGLMEKVLGVTTRSSRPELAGRVRETMLSSPAHGVIGALEAMAGRADNFDLVVDITVPVLVIAGEEDTLTPPGPTAEWASEIPDSRLVSVPLAGHIANLEAPERVNELVRSFVEYLTSVT